MVLAGRMETEVPRCVQYATMQLRYVCAHRSLACAASTFPTKHMWPFVAVSKNGQRTYGIQTENYLLELSAVPKCRCARCEHVN